MEPIWVLVRCYRGAGESCLVLGAYSSAASAIAHAEQREHIPIDAWQEPRLGSQIWRCEHRQYEFKLEAFMVPAAPLPPLDSIEVHSIH